MQRLSLSEFTITLMILLAITLGAGYKLRSWLLNVNEHTSGQIRQVSKIY